MGSFSSEKIHEVLTNEHNKEILNFQSEMINQLQEENDIIQKSLKEPK